MRTLRSAILVLSLLATATIPIGATPAVAHEQQAPGFNELLPPVLGILRRAFEPPPTPFAAGHRGVDVEVAPGITTLVAPLAGTVTTGVAAGNRYATIQTDDGLARFTLSYLHAVLVPSGRRVAAGQPVAIAGWGHGDGEVTEPHVHLSLRYADVSDPSGWRYADPMPDFRRYLRRVRFRIARIDLVGN